MGLIKWALYLIKLC